LQRDRVVLVGEQELDYVALVLYSVALGEAGLGAVELDQVVPAHTEPARQVQQQAVVDPDQARRVLRSLQIASRPVDSLRHRGQHQRASVSTIQVSLLPPPWEEFTT